MRPPNLWHLFLVLALAYSQTQACDIDGKSGIVEENDLYIGIHDKNVSAMTKADFMGVIADVEKIYARCREVVKRFPTHLQAKKLAFIK